MKAIAYIRVSTDKQELGPEAQRAAVKRWAAREGAEIVAEYVDHICGATPAADRPGLLSALNALGEISADVLIVAKRDRLARDVVESALTERLVERVGARVVSAAGEGTDADPDDPAALLMRRLVDAFAEYERAMIRARTRAALAVKKSRGERVGGIPYGARLSADGVSLEPVESELATIERAQALRAAGLSYRKISRQLASEGRLARTGRPFGTSQVGRLLAV